MSVQTIGVCCQHTARVGICKDVVNAKSENVIRSLLLGVRALERIFPTFDLVPHIIILLRDWTIRCQRKLLNNALIGLGTEKIDDMIAVYL